MYRVVHDDGIGNRDHYIKIARLGHSFCIGEMVWVHCYDRDEEFQHCKVPPRSRNLNHVTKVVHELLEVATILIALYQVTMCFNRLGKQRGPQAK